MRVYQSGTAGQEQARIVGRMFQQRVENINNFRIVLQHRITEAQKLAREGVVGMRFELAFERRESFPVKLGAEAGGYPAWVQARGSHLPCRGLADKTARFGEIPVFLPHHTPDGL